MKGKLVRDIATVQMEGKTGRITAVLLKDTLVSCVPVDETQRDFKVIVLSGKHKDKTFFLQKWQIRMYVQEE